MTEKLSNKLKLNKTNYIFIGVTIIGILATLNALDNIYIYSELLSLPKVLKSFLLHYSPMLVVIFSFFLWRYKDNRPNKLYVGLFITFFLDITLFGYLSNYFAELILNHGETIIIESEGSIPKGYYVYSYAYYILKYIKTIVQIVLAFLIFKRGGDEPKAFKAVLICFLIFMTTYFAYSVYVNLLFYGIISSPHSLDDDMKAKAYQYMVAIIGYAMRISRSVAIITIFPLIAQYQGESSLWCRFKNGPLRIFKKIMSAYNPNGVK